MSTKLHQYIIENSTNGRLNCKFVVLIITNTNIVLPCGCGAWEDQVIILHYGNTLYCCDTKVRRHPKECHAILNPEKIIESIPMIKLPTSTAQLLN